MTTPASPLDPIAALLCDDCRDELAGVAKVKFDEPPYDDLNRADWLARWTWESATFTDFPQRPTKRRWLAPFTREAVV